MALKIFSRSQAPALQWRATWERSALEVFPPSEGSASTPSRGGRAANSSGSQPGAWEPGEQILCNTGIKVNLGKYFDLQNFKDSFQKMSVIEKIIEHLTNYPQLTYQAENNKISILPATPEGFSVWLTENDPGFTVGFEGWHEEFFDQDEALNCFAFGLSDHCRLKVVKRGDVVCSWSVERWNENGWKNRKRARNA